MSNLIDCIYSANEEINIKLYGSKDQVRIITTKDIPSVVELYRSVYSELSQANCGKFIHNMDEEHLEELISHKESTIVGYFKEGKHLAGTLYTKPFGKKSPFFQTPSYEGDKNTYTVGGLVVNPEYRGNGVVSKMTSAVVNGVREYSKEDKSISGAGIEVSCENFGSLRALGSVKKDDGQPIFNFAGVHYLETPQGKDNDLTILGYTSFVQDEVSGIAIPQVTLNGNQQESFSKLTQAMQNIGAQSSGITTQNIDGNIIDMFSSYVHAPVIEVVNYDPVYSSNYPPQLEQGV